MKKLLLVATLGVAGLVSANNPNSEKKNSTEEEKTTTVEVTKENSSKASRIYDWYPVTTDCGQTYYLDLNMYDSLGAFLNDVDHFNEIKCPSGGSGNWDASLDIWG